MNEAQSWDERYRSSGAVWSGEPNAQLIAEVCGLVPSTALDVGCGEGADAIWLAQHGWHVTAIDISTVAIERSRALPVAPDVAKRIDWRQADFFSWTPPERSFGLVSAFFIQLAPPEREAVFRRLAAAVAPGGTMLVVGHHPSDLETSVRRPRRPGVLYAASEIVALLEPQAWEILVAAARPRNATDAEGNAAVVHDAILRARRR